MRAWAALILLALMSTAGCSTTAPPTKAPAVLTGGAAQSEPLDFVKMYVNGKLRDIEFLELSTFEGKHYFFEVTEAVLNGTPRWKENVAYPPLSPRDAEAAARAELQLLRPDVGAWMLVHIVLRQIIGQCWCYVVVFHRGDIAITGLPEYLSVPVLMNGQAVHGTPESQVGK